MSNIMEPMVFVSSVNTEMLYSDMVAKLFKLDTAEMESLHVAVGIAGEAGEICDALKKHVIYNKNFDRANIVEELGDLRFYMQHLMSMCGITEAEVLQGNADKLSKRYASLSYSGAEAIARADKND